MPSLMLSGKRPRMAAAPSSAACSPLPCPLVVPLGGTGSRKALNLQVQQGGVPGGACRSSHGAALLWAGSCTHTLHLALCSLMRGPAPSLMHTFHHNYNSQTALLPPAAAALL